MILYNDKIRDNIELILTELGIRYKKRKKGLSFPCPIHGGDKSNGATIYTDGEILTFRCFTEQCEREIGKSIPNFVKGVLSTTSGTEYSFKETLTYINHFNTR